MIETLRTEGEEETRPALNTIVRDSDEAFSVLDEAYGSAEALAYPLRVTGYVEAIGPTAVSFIVNTRTELAQAIQELQTTEAPENDEVTVRMQEVLVDKLSAVNTSSRRIERERGDPMKTVASSIEEALEKVRTDSTLVYPLLVIPWGENSGALQYVVQSDDDLVHTLKEIYETSGGERRVHLITKAGSVGNLWKQSGTIDPADGTIEAFKED